MARAWLALLRACRDKGIANALGGEQLGIVEIPDHAMVRKVFEKNRRPALGVGPYGKGNGIPDQAAPDINREGFCRLGNCRLTFPTSAILRHLRVARANGQRHMSSPGPLLRRNDPVDLRGGAVAHDKVTVKLHVWQALNG